MVWFHLGSVQCSRSVMSHGPHGPQQARPPCPSPALRVYPNPCPLSQWCHPTISSPVVPFSRPQSFPASGSFSMSWFLPSGSQSIGASASASVLPMNIQGWFPLGLTGLLSLQSKGSSGRDLEFLENRSSRISLVIGYGCEKNKGPVMTPGFFAWVNLFITGPFPEGTQHPQVSRKDDICFGPLSVRCLFDVQQEVETGSGIVELEISHLKVQNKCHPFYWPEDAVYLQEMVL